ncbi:MAG: hypothetical protein JJE40_19300 [Vicinamibacteria bacterium]|nr:hypothetical protein [Vicinamibacteria bacterium]
MIPDIVPAVAEQVSLVEAMVRLPLAAALGSALAMRPRRAGTPPRKPAVVQTQVILAVMGALVLIVVGANLARAFGVVGIAGLIRYRAKVDDPKDASVMLAGLGVGLACGVGLLYLAAAATAFLLALLWVLESKEADLAAPFTLKVSTADPAGLRRPVEALLRRHRLGYELRSWSQEELVYAVDVPLAMKTDELSTSLVGLSGKDKVGVEWGEKKVK